MARFMPQDLFDNLAITYLMCSLAHQLSAHPSMA
jgi:hypothetical protein